MYCAVDMYCILFYSFRVNVLLIFKDGSFLKEVSVVKSCLL